MQAYLFVIDYQNDFVDGALGREKPKSAQGKPRAGREKVLPGVLFTKYSNYADRKMHDFVIN